MADSDIARLHMFVSGRVQGVFFRGTVADEARSLGLTGWARNLADGRVEIVAEGKRANLRTLEAWAHQGPPSARVSGVDSEWSDYRGEFTGFSVR